MGFFDLFRKKLPEGPIEEYWSTADLDRNLSQLEKEELQKFYDEFNGLEKELESKLSAVKQAASELDKARMSKDVDRRVIIKVESTKNNLVNRTKNACDYLFERKLKPAKDVETLNKNIEVISRVFAQINEAGSKYSEIVSVGFPSQVSGLSKTIKDVNLTFKKMLQIVDQNKGRIESVADIRGILDKLASELERLEANRTETNRLQEANKSIQQQELDLQKRKEKMEGSSAYKMALELKAKADSLEQELNNLKLEFRNEFSAFKKPLQKYLHSFGPGLGRDLNLILERYLDEPLDALLIDHGFEVEHVLAKIAELSEAGKLGLDGRMKTKFKNAVERLRLREVLQRHKDLSHELNSIRHEIARSMITDREQVIGSLEELKHQVAENDKMLDSLNKTASEISENVHKLKSEIETKLKAVFERDIRLD
jgi:DNA repair exonuclease SbcCD ATPase subunit